MNELMRDSVLMLERGGNGKIAASLSDEEVAPAVTGTKDGIGAKLADAADSSFVASVAGGCFACR